MDTSHLPFAVKLFVGLGGVALVVGAVKKGARPGAKAAVGFLLKKSPAFRDAVVHHKADVEQVLEDAEKGVEDAIDEAAASDGSQPKAG